MLTLRVSQCLVVNSIDLYWELESMAGVEDEVEDDMGGGAVDHSKCLRVAAIQGG